MRSVKVILFLVFLSLAFQGWASVTFCDLSTDELVSEMQEPVDHDCCDSGSITIDQCQCDAMAVFVMPQSEYDKFSDSVNVQPNILTSVLLSIFPPSIYHPPRYA